MLPTPTPVPTPTATRLPSRPRSSAPPALRRRVRGRVATVAAIAALTLAALGPGLRLATVAADGAPGLADLTFFGRGYGHGVGMSQYGARGRATAGQLAPEILAHYYPGTSIGARSPATTVRVLLLTGFAASAARPLTVVGLVGGWTVDGIASTFPANARLTLTPSTPGATTWILRIRSATGTALATRRVSGDVYLRPVTGATVVQVVSKATPTNVYRGVLRIHLTTTALVANHIAVDQYLRGVVPSEMPSTWPTEALRAQAIAARSYALYRVHPSSGLFDVYDDTRSQVYRGKRVETSATNLAVSATAGAVLLTGSSLVNALFHSSDGGWTENNENVFVSAGGGIVAGAVPYLRGSSDRAPDGTSYDRFSPYATWRTATYPAAALSAFLATDPRTDVGLLSALDLSRRGVSGRLISVTLTGDLGTKTVSAEVFRTVFNLARPVADAPLRSTLFDTAPLP